MKKLSFLEKNSLKFEIFLYLCKVERYVRQLVNNYK